MLEFPVCETGDHVFVGKYANQLRCPTCNTARTGNCHHQSCKHIAADSKCHHKLKYRVPKRVVQYRPICIFLQRALKYELFRKLISCSFEETGLDYWDVLQKPVAQEQMAAMQTIWNARTDIDKTTCRPVNLLLSVSYDGVKIFKKKSAHFCPLVITILNLPPCFRNKKGFGMFVTSIFDGQPGRDYSDSEEFLFSKCLVAELLMLAEGMMIPCVDEDGKSQCFFVQVRLICHVYDTRELEPLMHITSTNSFAWCFFCGMVRGSNFKEVGNTCFLGNRGGLPLDSALRYYGQSMNCCPRGHYGEHPSHQEFAVDQEVVANITSNMSEFHHAVPRTITNGHDINKLRTCCVGKSHGAQVSQTLKSKAFVWFHSEYIPISEFQNVVGQYLYYVHQDFRPQILHKRSTNKEYFEKALQYFLQNHPNPLDGVRGLYAFAQLAYANIAKHLCWDPFHVFMNIAKHIILLWKGERATSNTVRQYCFDHHLHPSMYNVENVKSESSLFATQPVWVIPPTVRNIIDEVIKAILIPTGARDELQFRSIFATTGTLNGISKIKVLVTLMDVINLCLYFVMPKYPKAYLHFYKILSLDISMLMSRTFQDDCFDDMIMKTIETAALYEGLFPPSESLAVNHQLVDIAAHIKTFGPIYNWWGVAMERCVGDVATKCPAAGKKGYVTAFHREYQESDAILHESCNKRSGAILSKAVGQSRSVSLDVKNTTDETLPVDERDSSVKCSVQSFLKYEQRDESFTAMSGQSFCVEKDLIRDCWFNEASTNKRY